MTPDEEAETWRTSIDAGIRSTQLGRIDTDDGPVFVGPAEAFRPWHETSAEPFTGEPAPIWIGVDWGDGPDQTVYRQPNPIEQMRRAMAADRIRLPRHLLTLDFSQAAPTLPDE